MSLPCSVLFHKQFTDKLAWENTQNVCRSTMPFLWRFPKPYSAFHECPNKKDININPSNVCPDQICSSVMFDRCYRSTVPCVEICFFISLPHIHRGLGLCAPWWERIWLLFSLSAQLSLSASLYTSRVVLWEQEKGDVTWGKEEEVETKKKQVAYRGDFPMVRTKHKPREENPKTLN